MGVSGRNLLVCVGRIKDKLTQMNKDKRLSKSDVKEQVQIITNLKPVQSY